MKFVVWREEGTHKSFLWLEIWNAISENIRSAGIGGIRVHISRILSESALQSMQVICEDLR